MNNMDEQKKAEFYNFLLSEHTKLYNQIQLVKSENVNLNQEQESRIKELEQKQNMIMFEVQKLLM